MLNRSISVVIPCINIDHIVLKTIKILQNLDNIKTNFFILTDKKEEDNIFSPNVNIIQCNNLNMSQKRNLAVSKSSDNYIAFIDSDAYPSKDWLLEAIIDLENNNKIGIVTGPDLVPPEQDGWEKIVGDSHKSFLLSGSKTYRKIISKRKYCDQASSCNMILRKSTFLNLQGMDEKIYIGEDVDFCNRIKKNNLLILYNPNAQIFHFARKFKYFLIQRFLYGTCVFEVISFTHFFSYSQYLLPLLILLYLVLTLIISFFNYVFIYFFIVPFVALLILFLYESFMITNKFSLVLKHTLLFFLNLLFFGSGSFFALLNIKINRKKLYIKR